MGTKTASSGRGRFGRRLVLAALVSVATVIFVSAAAADIPGQIITPTVDEATLSEIAEWVESQRSLSGIPGLAAGIVVGDEVVFLEGFGHTEIGGAPIEPATPFLLSSTTKSITALGLMRLVEEDMVDLDQPITSYIPELAPKGDSVSVRDLMHHRSGLSRYAGIEGWESEVGASLKSNVVRLGPQLVANAEYAYSNANYDALALIIERVSGMPFADYMAANVFTPLDMSNSSYDLDRARAAGLSQGHYRWLFIGYQPHEMHVPAGLAGSATMFSSAEDLTHTLLAHLNQGVYQDTNFLSEDSMAVLHEPRSYGSDVFLGYAGGWWVSPAFGPDMPGDLSELTLLAHGGGATTYRSVIWIMPEVELGFVLLANGNDVSDESGFDQIGLGVRFLLFGLDPPDLPNRAPLLIRYGKHLLLAVVVAQALLAVAVIPALPRPGRGLLLRRRDRKIVAGATALDIAAIVAVLWVIPAAGESPLGVVLKNPDYRILVIGMGIGVVWGAVRTILLANSLTRRRRASVAPR